MDTYAVAPGDSLYFISKKFDTSVDALMQTNGLTGDHLDIGQILYIPAIALPEGTYGIGSSGPEVRAVQKGLAAVGYDVYPDGVYGNATSNAIYVLQQKHPEALAADGIYGPMTRVYLARQLDTNYHIIRDPYPLLVLVNKHNSLPADYVPQNLTVPNIEFSFDEYRPQKLMRADAAQALQRLFAQAKKENIALLGVSGYRSYTSQASIFANNIYSRPDANATSARPGESEHQTGLAIDVTSPSVNYALTPSFGDTAEGEWLAANAPGFGFIIRYPQGKEGITEYRYEPWHIRYVGVPAAGAISGSGLTLEEYLGLSPRLQ